MNGRRGGLAGLPFPTRRMAVVVAVVSLCWLLPGRWGIVVAFAALAAVIIVALYDAVVHLPSASEIVVQREIADTLGIGDTASGQYLLRSAWRSAVQLDLYDDPGAGVIRHGSRPAAVSLPPRGERVVPLELEGRRRGSWPLGPVALRVRSPVGLLQRTLHYEDDARIGVTPSVSGVRRYRLLTLQHRMKDLGVRSTRRRGEGTTFSHLREYQIGDDPRHVDWKATARRRQLISREYTVEQGQTVIIAIDLGRMMTQMAGPLPRLEYALNSSLVLADVVASSGDRVGVIAFDDDVRAFVPPMAGPGAVARVREALVPLRATMMEPDYALAFRTLTARHRKRSLIVLFTDVIDVRASQALIAHTTRSAERHLPLVVALRNEQLLTAAAGAAQSRPSALYERAAAEELLQARDEALLRMRRAGVSVLDVPPEAMTAPLINRYLELKARASL